MSTTTRTSSNSTRLKRWITPAVGLAIGVAYLIAGLMSGNPGAGVYGFAIMAVLAVGMLLAARRSETVQGLLDHRDERIATIDLKATAFAGSVVIAAIIIAFVVELAQGHDGAPYHWLGALGGNSYLAAVIALRLRG